ncbi:MAG: glycosyltransferase [Dehalococcoidia bacterium]
MTGPALAFCLEQTLGHRAHGLNLEAAIAAAAPDAAVHRIEYPEGSRLPVPWAVRGSALAWRSLRGGGKPAATLFHTSTISLFAPQAARGGRYIVSVDATPAQLDQMGQWYGHAQGSARAERAKRAWYRRVLGGAASVVAWSSWAADSLVRDYGVRRERILVAHPGAGRGFFEIERDERPHTPRILFVGGDFQRKGGDTLLEAFAPLAGRAELTVVSDAELPPMPGVRHERGLRPGTGGLVQAFAEADIFCLPTRGDCTPVAIGEAMAAGLPVITTRVGSNPETVVDGVDGLLIEPGSVASLAEALRSLVDDAGVRVRMGAAARAAAHERMDAEANALRIIERLKAVA